MYLFKMEDMENKLHRNNVRIFGLLKHCEGSNPVGFMKKWLVEMYGKEFFPLCFHIDCYIECHCRGVSLDHF